MIDKTVLFWLCVASLIEIFGIGSLIHFFHKRRAGQEIRQLGPSGHQKKKGTPTMGGLIFHSVFLLILPWGWFLMKFPFDYHFFTILLTVFGYGIIGFIDDYLIVVKKNNQGFRTKPKFICQLAIALAVYFLLLHGNHSVSISIFSLDIGFNFLYGFLILFLLAGGSNAVNLTDGLDGLATCTLLISFGGILVYSFLKQIPELSLIMICAIVCLLIFLMFNAHPAQIFMGNTGSMALGALLAIVGIVYKFEFLLIGFAFIFGLETISVILQVSYFKMTKGKRLFKMAPLHHHYELKGMSENKVNLLFSSIELIVVAVTVWVGCFL